MFKSLRAKYSESIATIIALGVELVGTFFLMKFLSLYMDKNFYGEYLLYASIFSMVLVVSFSAMDQGFLRNIAAYHSDEILKKRFSALIVVYVIISFVFAGVVLILHNAFLYGEAEAILALAFWIGMRAIANLQIIFVNGLRRRWVDVESKLIDLSLKVLILYFLKSMGKLEIDNVIYGQALSSLMQMLYISFVQRSYFCWVSLKDMKVIVIDVMRFCWPMIIWGGFGWMQTMSARWIVDQYMDKSVVAEYAVLYSIASLPTSICLGLATNYFIPIIYQRSVNGCEKDIKKSLAKLAFLFLMLSIAMVGCVYIFSEKLILLASSEKYLSGKIYLPFIAIALALSSSASILSYYSFVQKNLKTLLLPSILPGAVMVLMCTQLVPSDGLVGVVISLLVTNFISAALNVYIFNANLEKVK
jgi:O-antigen/teichoic acid export membrane protein